MKDASAADYVVGVIGAGAMGQGIAQVSAQGKIRTLVFDVREGASEKAKQSIGTQLARQVEKGRMSQDDADAALARIEPVSDIKALAPCDAIVEAIFEDLDVKHAVFKDIAKVVSPDCLIASNTSSISISAIASALEHRGRFAGMHFFNPVPVMKLVELIRGSETSDEAVAQLDTLGKRFGRVPVVVKDQPGFLVNFGGRAYTTEGLRLEHEGVATPAEIDAILTDGRKFRLGPFALMDLTGIDVNFPASLIIYDGYMQDPRIKTAPNHRSMLDAGLFGRKTGQGWYKYEKGVAVDVPSPDFTPDAEPARRVALAEPDAALQSFCEGLGLAVVQDDGAMPIMAAPIGDDATHTALATHCDYKRLVCVDLSCDTSVRVTLMTAPGADLSARDAVAAALVDAGRKVTVIKDSPGFVAQRMIAMIANLGCYVSEVGLATPDDTNTALKLGLNYPMGPLEFATDLGLSTCLRILERLHAITGEDRYRPTMWLKRRAALGLPIDTPN